MNANKPWRGPKTMIDLSDKISFDEIVRYLFTGLSICCGYLIASNTSPSCWFKANTWASRALPASLGIFVVIYAGYIVFQIYRAIVYHFFIISVRAWIYLSPKYNYLRGRAKEMHISINRITFPNKIENVYFALIRPSLIDKYRLIFPAISTVIHVMYCSSIILLAFSICGKDCSWIIASCILFIAAVTSDYCYESIEVIILKTKKDAVKEALEFLKRESLLNKKPKAL